MPQSTRHIKTAPRVSGGSPPPTKPLSSSPQHGDLEDNVWFRTATGALLQREQPRALTEHEAARLLALGVASSRECNTRYYEFGCACESCRARDVHAEEFGYDSAGKLNPRTVAPVAAQPWDVRPARRRVA